MITGFAAGVVLGLLFYGGLWITVRTLLSSPHPVAVTMLSYLFRVAVTIGSFVFIARGGWVNALACLAGFIAGRIVVSRTLPVCT